MLCMLRGVLRNPLSESPTAIVPGPPLLYVRTFWPPVTCSMDISAASWQCAAFNFCGVMPCSAWLDEQCQTCMATQPDALLSLLAGTACLSSHNNPSADLQILRLCSRCCGIRNMLSTVSLEQAQFCAYVTKQHSFHFSKSVLSAGPIAQSTLGVGTCLAICISPASGRSCIRCGLSF